MLKPLHKKLDSCPAARRCAPVALLLGMMASLPASAALSDTIKPFVGVSYGYDDNLFRLQDNNPAKEGDTIKSMVAGLSFERPVGRQLFTGSAKVTRVSFGTFDQLDYNGKDAALNWQWQFGNHFDGTAGATYSEVLSSFSDFHSTEKNIRKTIGEYASANWRFHPSWRLRGRASRDKYTYDLLSQQYLDRTENRGEVGFDYLAASGSTIGLQARRSRGSYPHPLQFGGFVDDEGYKQTDLQLNVYWRYSAVTQVQFVGGRAKREHTLFSSRDSSGTNGRLTATWSPRVALQLVGNAWREFQPFEGSLASYSLSTGASVSAMWAVTSKIQTQADLKYVKRDFQGIAGLAVPLSTTDNTRSVSLGATYMILQNLQLSANVFHDTRSAGSVFSTQYRANGATLSANIQF